MNCQEDVVPEEYLAAEAYRQNSLSYINEFKSSQAATHISGGLTAGSGVHTWILAGSSLAFF